MYHVPVERVTYKSAFELRRCVHLIGALFDQCEARVERSFVVRSLVEGVAIELDLVRECNRVSTRCSHIYYMAPYCIGALLTSACALKYHGSTSVALMCGSSSASASLNFMFHTKLYARWSVCQGSESSVRIRSALGSKVRRNGVAHLDYIIIRHRCIIKSCAWILIVFKLIIIYRYSKKGPLQLQHYCSCCTCCSACTINKITVFITCYYLVANYCLVAQSPSVLL